MSKTRKYMFKNFTKYIKIKRYVHEPHAIDLVNS